MASVLQGELRGSAMRQQIAGVIRTIRAGANGPLRPVFQRIAARYLGFVRTRFVNASRGDGTWLPLARSTRLAKLRKIAPARFRQLVKATGKTTRAEQLAALVSSRPFPILRDTSNLFGSLATGAPGNVLRFAGLSVATGTNVFYARDHQSPSKPGRPPQRLILVPPDQPTDAAIAREIDQGFLAVLRAGAADQASAAGSSFSREGAD
jgi:hypothetical protein